VNTPPTSESENMSDPDKRTTEHELTRTKGDRRLYAIEGIGSLRLNGVAVRTATAESASGRWRIASRGFWRRFIQATDEAGVLVGEFEQRRGARRGGALRWGDRTFTLRPGSSWRERYMLADGDRELAILDGKGWGRRPVTATVDHAALVEPGLLLFATFVVHALATDAVTAVSAVSAATTSAATASCG
jgi:hypothetical protein